MIEYLRLKLLKKYLEKEFQNRLLIYSDLLFK